MKKIIIGWNVLLSALGRIAISFVILITTIMSSDYAHATCPSRASQSGTISGLSVSGINVTSAAVGELIGTGSTSVGTSPSILNIHDTIYYSITKFTTLSSLGNGIYDTNLSGIGIRITFGAAYFPGNITYTGQGISQPATYTVQLYKTASTVQSGTLQGGSIATLSCGGPTSNIYNIINLPSNITIVNSACTSQFSSVGSTSSGTAFTIPLTCPSAGVSVKMQLDGTTVSGYNNALALSDSGSNGVASGYGVQVLTGSSPVIIGTPTQVATTTSGQVNVPLTARYIKTAASSSSGTANSTATFTMTYQ